MNFDKIVNSKGADQIELCYNSLSSKDVSVKKNEIYNMAEKQTSGAGIRAIVNGKIGFAYTSNLNKLNDTLKKAIRLAKFSNQKVKLKSYPKYTKAKGIYDKSFEKANDKKIFEDIHSAIKFAKENNSMITDGGVSLAIAQVIYMNSEGANLQEKETYRTTSSLINYKDSEGVWETTSTKNNNDFKETTKKAIDIAKKNSIKEDIKTGKYDVVFHPFSLSSIFGNAIYPNFNAEFIQKGKSKLGKELGNKVFSDKLNIVDTGILPGAWGSHTFDAEGVPTQETVLVKNGVIKNFMYDLVRAQKEGKESTGNAAREYSTQPSISPSNFIIKPGKKDPIKEIDKGLLIYHPLNAHSISPSSGDFSLGVYLGFLIKNGEIKYAPKHAMISGNIFDLFKNIKFIGNDTINVGELHSPSIVATTQVIGI